MRGDTKYLLRQRPQTPAALDVAARMREYSLRAKELMQQQRAELLAKRRAEREAMAYEEYKIKNKLVDIQQLNASKAALYASAGPPKVISTYDPLDIHRTH